LMSLNPRRRRPCSSVPFAARSLASSIWSLSGCSSADWPSTDDALTPAPTSARVSSRSVLQLSATGAVGSLAVSDNAVSLVANAGRYCNRTTPRGEVQGRRAGTRANVRPADEVWLCGGRGRCRGGRGRGLLRRPDSLADRREWAGDPLDGAAASAAGLAPADADELPGEFACVLAGERDGGAGGAADAREGRDRGGRGRGGGRRRCLSRLVGRGHRRSHPPTRG
jgi:hypothetical protein